MQLTASASDDIGVAKVEFLANGAVVATDTTAPYAASWDSTTVANGQVQLTARASDAAGHATTSTPVAVTVQNTAPAAPTLTAPTAASAGATVTVSWSGVAAPTAKDWVGLYRQGAADTATVWWFFDSSCTSTAGTAKASGSCSLTLPTSTGTYELRLVANNGYTRLATSSPLTVS